MLTTNSPPITTAIRLTGMPQLAEVHHRGTVNKLVPRNRRPARHRDHSGTAMLHDTTDTEAMAANTLD